MFILCSLLCRFDVFFVCGIVFSYIASYIDAKGKAGLFDDIKALYKDEKNKREKI